MKIPSWLGIFALTVSLIFLAGGVVFPLGSVFFEALRSQASGASSEGLLQITRITALQAGLSTLFSAAGGLALGLFIASSTRFARRQSKICEALLAMPFGIPTIVVAFGWIAILGRNGLLARLGIRLDWAYTLNAVILANVFLNLPWVALAVLQACKQVPERFAESARTLGAGVFRVFRTATWPWIQWSLLSVLCQVFSLCTMSFTIVLLLGAALRCKL